jgi:hypothetical protein
VSLGQPAPQLRAALAQLLDLSADVLERHTPRKTTPAVAVFPVR